MLASRTPHPVGRGTSEGGLEQGPLQCRVWNRVSGYTGLKAPLFIPSPGFPVSCIPFLLFID